MGTRKTVIKPQAGAKLQRIERLADQRSGAQSSWRLITPRADQPRAFADEAAVQDAIAIDVIAA